MISFEYDPELAKEAARLDGLDEGRSEGLAEGLAEGEGRMSKLITVLLKNRKMDDLSAITENVELRQKLYAKYGIA